MKVPLNSNHPNNKIY